MPVGPIIGAVGAVAGGVAGGKGAKKAARIQQQSADKQMALQRELYNKTSANFAPDIASGNRAGASIDQLLGLAPSTQSPTDILRSTPGYQYRMQEALGAVNSGAAVRGLYRSGAAMKALQDRAYNVADQGFNTHLAQVTNVANRGMGAKSSMAGVSQNYGNASNGIAQNNANAQSNNAIFQGQNFANTLQGVLGAVGSAFPSAYGSSYAPSGPATSGQTVPSYRRG